MASPGSDASVSGTEVPSSNTRVGPLGDDAILRLIPDVDGLKALGPCFLQEKLGQGGMGAVYRARHRKFDIDVCVKCLFPRLDAEGLQIIERFKREAKLLAKLNHPNLVRVYDVDNEHGVYYLVMELVEGDTARKLVARRGGPLGEAEAVRVILQASRGLAAAHAAGIVHRDIKPDNILIRTDGEVKLADLGLAVLLERREEPALLQELTGSATVMGTSIYMPPEQWEGLGKVGPQGDVWALGATLYFLLAGQDAYSGSPVEVMHRICGQPFPDILKVRPGLPPPLVEIVGRCTERKPEDRFTDGQQIGEQLEEYAQKHLPRALHAGDQPACTLTEARLLAARRKPRGFFRSRRAWVAAAVLVLLAGAAGFLAMNGVFPGSNDELAEFIPRGKNVQNYEEYEHKRTGIVMVRIPGGSFDMGSEDGNLYEQPVHKVTLDPFLIAKHEVTRAEWAKVMHESAPDSGKEDLPQNEVSWNRCMEFCDSALLSLPTEAQWEYACRAPAGQPTTANRDLKDKAWLHPYSDGKPNPVGRKAANGAGLHDMLGNLSEWCADAYDERFYTKPEASGPNPKCITGTHRVFRGGNFETIEDRCRPTIRWGRDPAEPLDDVGFRPAFNLTK